VPAPETLSWSAPSTTPAEIEAALRRLLISCHDQAGACVPARVLNLVCVVDRAASEAIAHRLAQAGRYHASRTIMCAVEPGRRTIGAVAALGTAFHRPRGDFALLRESITLEVGERHLAHLDTIVDPLVVSDLPTVLWCAQGHEGAARALLPLTQAVLLDSSDVTDAREALARARQLLRTVEVVDLAWLRSTPWRERIAAAFDLPHRRWELPGLSAVTVRHHADSAVAGLLLLGWLGSRLRWHMEALRGDAQALSGDAWGAAGAIRLTLMSDEHQPVRGLAGVALETRSGWRFSLDRGPGGLRAAEREPGGRQRSWTVLGASRGEPGILGDGIRHALLRDHAFGPAAREADRLAGVA
jgi:glucose-6-phosphate dehydrogenase assembly protein OpcA